MCSHLHNSFCCILDPNRPIPKAHQLYQSLVTLLDKPQSSLASTLQSFCLSFYGFLALPDCPRLRIFRLLFLHSVWLFFTPSIDLSLQFFIFFYTFLFLLVSSKLYTYIILLSLSFLFYLFLVPFISRWTFALVMVYFAVCWPIS